MAENTTKPRFCYYCGNKLVCNSSHQINFCDQCGVQQIPRTSSQSSSLVLNGGSNGALGINISHNSQQTSQNHFSNSLKSTLPQHSGCSGTPASNPLPQDIPDTNRLFATSIPDQMNSSLNRINDCGNSHKRAQTHTGISGSAAKTSSMQNEKFEESFQSQLSFNEDQFTTTFSINNSKGKTIQSVATPSYQSEHSPTATLSAKDLPEVLPEIFPDDPYLQWLVQYVDSSDNGQTLPLPTGQSVNAAILANPRESLEREVVIEKDDYGDTTLNQYIQQNNTKAALLELQRLVDTYANDKETFLKYVNKRNERGEVALQSAIKNQNVEIIENLLKNDVDVTILDHDGNNILHLIVLTSSTEEIVLRLLRGVFEFHPVYHNEIDALLKDDSKAFNTYGFTVVHEVTKRSFGDTLKFLKEKGANLNMMSGRAKKTALVIACKKRNWPIVEILVALGACVNIPTSSEWYPVHAAIKDNNAEKLEFFMNKGVDIYGYKKLKQQLKRPETVFSAFGLQNRYWTHNINQTTLSEIHDPEKAE